MKLTRDSAISEITWRQPPGDSVGNESMITMKLENIGGGTWIELRSDGFAFDSADEILNLAVIAEDLREKHEKARVYG